MRWLDHLPSGVSKIFAGTACAVLIIAAASATTAADGWGGFFHWKPRPKVDHFFSGPSFKRISTFANYKNNQAIGDATVSEIVAATANGRILVYTDSPLGEIGFIDIANPADPQPLGKLGMPGRGNGDPEPTSVDVLGNRYALVAVNDSNSFLDPTGYLAVVDLTAAPPAVVHQIDLGGQPDSLKISPDRRYAAIAIENQRDEEVSDGELPQLPAGYLAVIELVQPVNPVTWTRYDVDLTGLASYASEDPEPEFVDVDEHNRAVVTLQENNHVAIVNLRTRQVVSHFPAGSVDLTGIDQNEDGLIALADNAHDVPREPDAVVWVPAPFFGSNIATANEGDLFGGSRGFTIFRPNGAVAFESGSSLESLAVRHGHYPEDRSENKGTEPEAVEYGRFNGADYVFVGSERGSFVAVYKLDWLGRPVWSQLLPAPFGPEGLLAIPQRNLLVVSGENDAPSFGVRSTVMIYQLTPGVPKYPQILSADDDEGLPIGWSALSGLTSIPGRFDSLLAVWDGYYSKSQIFRIDVSEQPALITEAVTIEDNGIGTGSYDPEGIAVAPDSTMWVATEGDASDAIRNRLLQIDPATGNVLAEVQLPADILACRAAEFAKSLTPGPPPNGSGTLGSGFEGVAVLSTGGDGYRLFVAQQRGWNYTTSTACNLLDDDPADANHLEPTWTRIWIYDPAAETWDFLPWQLQPKPANASWVGLSEITRVPGGWILIERDNRTGDFGVLKTLAKVEDSDGGGGFTNPEKQIYDLRPALTANNGWITDKPEGVAVMDDGRTFVVTDNDGVEGWSGETWFLRLGRYWSLFQ